MHEGFAEILEKKVNYLRRFIGHLSRKIIPFTHILRLKDESKFTCRGKAISGI
jgi:hypothetical protein